MSDFWKPMCISVVALVIGFIIAVNASSDLTRARIKAGVFEQDSKGYRIVPMESGQ